MLTAIRLFALACLVAGCAGLKTDYEIAKERAQTYVAAHPKLATNTADAIGSNSIHEGMSMEQVIAAWGRPVVVQKFRDGSLQYWFFGCDWPHYCQDLDLGIARSLLASPDDIYYSRALFQNGVVVDWQS